MARRDSWIKPFGTRVLFPSESKTFLLARYEVTNGQFLEFVEPGSKASCRWPKSSLVGWGLPKWAQVRRWRVDEQGAGMRPTEL